jgi:hypothetical protein
VEHEFRMAAGDVIHSDYLVRGMPRPPPLMRSWWSEAPVDFRAQMQWLPACTLELDVRLSPVGAEQHEGVHVPSSHYSGAGE